MRVGWKQWALLVAVVSIAAVVASQLVDRTKPGATSAGPVTKDCNGGVGCPPLTIAGDPPSSGTALSGYADPSIRQGPDGVVYLGYSWPTKVVTPTFSARSTIELHLARSLDGGRTWSLLRRLFPVSGPETVPGGCPVLVASGCAYPAGAQGVTTTEEIALTPAALDPTRPETPYWISAREMAWESDAYPSREATPTGMKGSTWHFRIGMVQASSPAGLGDEQADEQALASTNTDAAFRAAVAPANRVRFLPDLLPPTVACNFPLSPALYVRNDPANRNWPTVYLVIECGASMQVIKTTPYDGTIVLPSWAWNWTYVGSFATPADASALRSGANVIIQPDLAVDPATGQLLLVATASNVTATGRTGNGCDLVEMTGIDPPAFRRDANTGALVVRAAVTTSDLSGATFGDQAGACSYEPRAAIGLLQVRKKTSANRVIRGSINDTGLRLT